MNRVALVTGGAQRIGAAISRALAADGCAVLIHCNRSLGEAEALAEALRARGASSAVVQGDLGGLNDVPAFWRRACAPFGPPEILVNNASILLDDQAETFTLETMASNFALNLQAPLLLAQAFARSLPAEGRGAIINLIDQRVLRPTPQFFSYSLAKSALFAATRTLAQSFAPRIRVNGVGPGPTFANERDGVAGLQREAAGTLLGKVIDADEIARAVAFLANSSDITGQMLAVDGGQHLGWRTPDIVE